MTYPEFKRRLTILADFYKKQSASGKLIERAFDMSGHCGIEFGHELASAYTAQLAEAVGDQGNWIEYWLWECDMGKREMGWSKKDKPISRMKTIKDLWNAIKADQ